MIGVMSCDEEWIDVHVESGNVNLDLELCRDESIGDFYFVDGKGVGRFGLAEKGVLVARCWSYYGVSFAWEEEIAS